jgi:hypothetical protein
MHFYPHPCPSHIFQPHLCVSTPQPHLLSPPMISFNPQPCVLTAHPPVSTTFEPSNDISQPSTMCFNCSPTRFDHPGLFWHQNARTSNCTCISSFIFIFILCYFSLFHLKRVYEQSYKHFLYLLDRK